MHLLEKQLRQKLNIRQQAGNLRVLKAQSDKIDFCSNDYLGLARNPELAQKVEESYQKLKPSFLGATGSRLVTGTHPFALELEDNLATLFKGEKALLFNSGYQANSALLATIPQEGDLIVCDELIHASLREGARLSFATRKYFKHNDWEDLEKQIQENQANYQHIFVVTESVFSMEGDFGELEQISKVCKKHNVYLILDEAHSTGIWGENGNGYACELGLETQIFARIYTFGKALGSHGAVIVGNQVLIDYLINFARSFIFTTALPLHSLVCIQEGFQLLKEQPQLAQDLKRKIKIFRDGLDFLEEQNEVQLLESQSPIQILRIGGNERTKAFAQFLWKEGFDIRPILSPTVKKGQEILRICLHQFNSEEEIQKLLDCLKLYYHEHLKLETINF